MDLMQSADQDAIQETVRSFLTREMPLDRVRKSFDGGVDLRLTDLWRRAAELGFFGLGLPEGQGGAGFSLTEEMVLFNQLGRSLAPGPWLGSVLAARALDEASLRAPVVAGEVPCALVEIGDDDRIGISGDRLDGSLRRVADAAVAQGLLVCRETDWLYVPRQEAGWQCEAVRSLDPTRPLYRVSLESARYAVVADGDAAAALRRVATVLRCAEAVGGIEKTVEMSVEYCMVRTQFDRPIGSFQAVKHRCADMAVRAEVARAATIYATVCLRDGVAEAERQVAVAKLLCGDAYLRNAADNIQNHGGMGFTWECDAHLYLKRAHGLDLAFGSGRRQLDRLVETLRADSRLET